MTDGMDIQIRFHGEEAPLGPYGEEAERLAFPDGKFASKIEYAGRTWMFHSTELLKGPNDNEPRLKRLVYTDIRPR